MESKEQEAIKELKRTIKNSHFCDSIGTGQIEILLNYIGKLQKSNKEWFDIADDILRATNKYGEISIGEVANYIDKLEKENEELKRELDNLIKENHKHIDYIASMKKKQEDKIRNKIRNKIKELEEQHDIEKDMYKRLDIEAQIEVLEELLGDDE